MRNIWGFLRDWVCAAPWSGRRFAVLAGFVVFYPIAWFLTWVGLLMDEVFFRGYRRQVVRSPVFILGNFRSGTTYLHRLLARDKDTFATMCLWEILFAPSLFAHCCLRVTGRALGVPGRALMSLLKRSEQKWEERNPTHKISFFEPEEDDYLMLHVFSSLTVGLSAGLPAQAAPFVRFDDRVDRLERKKLMKFYRTCLQRFLHGRGEAVRYLAKAPALTPKIRSLAEEFPDAKFVVMVRDPREVLPSVSSMMRATWRVLGVPEPSESLREFLLDMAGHWYLYPRKPNHSEIQIFFIHYKELVTDPVRVVESLYEWLEIEVGNPFRQVLAAQAERARDYNSRHDYSIEGEGFDPEVLEKLASDVDFQTGFPPIDNSWHRPGPD